MTMHERNSESSRGREQSWLLRQFVRPVKPHIGENASLPQGVVIAGIIALMFISFVVFYNIVGHALGTGAPAKTVAPAGLSIPTTGATRTPANVSATAVLTPTRAPGSSPVPTTTATRIPPTVAQPTALPIGATAAPPAAGNTKYKVKAGDTLLSIALKYGVSVQAIRTANNMKNDTIYAGEELVIPTVR